MFQKTLVAAALAAAALSASAADYYVVTPVPGKTFSQTAISVTLNSYTLPAAVVGLPYSGFDFKTVLQVLNDPTFTSSAVTWSVDGALPSGMSLNATTGVLSGTPTVQGTFPVSVKATYRTKTGTQTYTVAVGDITVALNAATLPQATLGQAFTYDLKNNLSIVGDPSPEPSSATWSVSPALPGGLSLSSVGVINGTPTTVNVTGSTFEVTSNYKNRTAKQSYTLKVADAPISAADYRLLLHVEGKANGAATAADFVDSTPTPIAVSSVGTATVDTTTSALGSGSLRLNNFWGSPSWGSSWVAYPVQTGGERRFAMGSGDFTVESYVKSSSFGCYGANYFTYGAVDWTNGVWTRSWSVETTNTGQLVFQVFNDNGTSAFKLTSTTTIPTSTWTHIGVSRKSGTVRLFINGSQVASGTYAGGMELTRYATDIPFVIGKPVGGGNGCSSGVHNFDEVRVLKGYGVSTLPVPTTPYVPGTN